MITPFSKDIEELLGSQKIEFEVPDYQREFNWGMTELQELIDDLKQSTQNKSNGLFLGSFILEVSQLNKCRIVDGQQRLTSISILFIAIREHAKKLNDLTVAQQVQQFISLHNAVRGTNKIKFSVSRNIKEIYNHIADPDWDGNFPSSINGKGIQRQVNKVKPIFQYLQKSIESFNITELREFCQSLLDTYVIIVEVDNTEDVFAVFERTNARGLDLNIGDLLKNYIFSYKIPGLDDDWDEIVENANGKLPRMLKYFWVSRRGYIQHSKLYRNIKSYVNNKKKNPQGIITFVQELLIFSDFYASINDKDQNKLKNWMDVNDLKKLISNQAYFDSFFNSLQVLKAFKITQPIPLIFAFLMNFKRDKAQPVGLLVKLLNAIENYHFVNNVISGRVGNEVERFYSDLAPQIFDSSMDFKSNADKFLNELRKKKALKDEFSSNFIDKVTYGPKNFVLVNYVFDKINNHASKGGQIVRVFNPDPRISTKNFNIEHILAQSHKKQYSASVLGKFDEIGNLLVISRHTNSSLGNMSPLDKANLLDSDPKYFGPLSYGRKFLDDYWNDFPNWNLDTIEKRSKQIAADSYSQYWNF